MADRLMVVLCAEQNLITFIEVTEEEQMRVIKRATVFKNEKAPQVFYKSLVLVKDAPNAYQVFL